MTDRLPVDMYHQLVVLRRRELMAEAERDRLVGRDRPQPNASGTDRTRIVGPAPIQRTPTREAESVYPIGTIRAG